MRLFYLLSKFLMSACFFLLTQSIKLSMYMLVLVPVLLLTNPQKLWTDDNIHFLFSIKGFKLDLHVTIWKLPFIHQFPNNVDSLIMPPFFMKAIAVQVDQLHSLLLHFHIIYTCISIVSNDYSWDLQSSQENLKTILMQNFWG